MKVRQICRVVSRQLDDYFQINDEVVIIGHNHLYTCVKLEYYNGSLSLKTYDFGKYDFLRANQIVPVVKKGRPIFAKLKSNEIDIEPKQLLTILDISFPSLTKIRTGDKIVALKQSPSNIGMGVILDDYNGSIDHKDYDVKSYVTYTREQVVNVIEEGKPVYVE